LAEDGAAPRRLLLRGAIGAGAVGQSLAVGGGLVVAALALSLLGVRGFGTLSVLTTLSVIASTIGRMGLDRRASVLVLHSRRSERPTSLLLPLSATAAVTLLVGSGFGLAASFGGFVHSPSLTPLEVVALLAMWSSLDAVRVVLTAALRSNGQIVQGLFVGQPGRNVLIAVVLAIVRMSTDQATVSDLVQVMVLTSLVLASLGLIMSARWLRPSRSGRARQVLQLGAGFILTLVVLSNMLVNQVDLLVVAQFAGSDRDAGLYAVAMKLATLMAFPIGVMNLVLSPTIYRLYISEQRASAQALASRAALVGCGITLAIGATAGVGFGLYGPRLNLVREDDLFEVLILFSLLGAGQLFNALSGMSTSVYVLAGGERTILAGTLMIGIGAVGLESLAAWGIGTVGVATVSGLALGAQATYIAVMAKKKLGISLVAGSRGNQSAPISLRLEA
jgi:O-antigen/teichoic acid export membrane protein